VLREALRRLASARLFEAGAVGVSVSIIVAVPVEECPVRRARGAQPPIEIIVREDRGVL
jgi:hypothetical protein